MNDLYHEIWSAYEELAKNKETLLSEVKLKDVKASFEENEKSITKILKKEEERREMRVVFFIVALSCSVSLMLFASGMLEGVL